VDARERVPDGLALGVERRVYLAARDERERRLHAAEPPEIAEPFTDRRTASAESLGPAVLAGERAHRHGDERLRVGLLADGQGRPVP
jgi:hypothetical protein